MARLIVFADYLKNKFSKPHVINNIKYMATREGVVPNLKEDSHPFQYIVRESMKGKPITPEQEAKIDEFISGSPELKELFTYEDLMRTNDRYHASVFLADAASFMYEKSAGTDPIYLRYISERPGVALQEEVNHGLFDQNGVADLSAYTDELLGYSGNVYRLIVSLRRDDAERQDMAELSDWKGLLQTQLESLGKDMGMLPGQMRWVAAFHDESYHPHAHVMIWNKNPNPNATFLDVKALNHFKHNLVKQIFADELVHDQKVADFIRSQAEDSFRQQLNRLIRPKYESLKKSEEAYRERLYALGKSLPVQGKKSYQYLPKDIKKDVDALVGSVLKEPAMKELMEKYMDGQKKIYSYYRKDMEKVEKEVLDKLVHPGRAQRKVLHNSVIKAAEEIYAIRTPEVQNVDPAAVDHPTRDKEDLWFEQEMDLIITSHSGAEKAEIGHHSKIDALRQKNGRMHNSASEAEGRIVANMMARIMMNLFRDTEKDHALAARQRSQTEQEEATINRNRERKKRQQKPR